MKARTVILVISLLGLVLLAGCYKNQTADQNAPPDQSSSGSQPGAPSGSPANGDHPAAAGEAAGDDGRAEPSYGSQTGAKPAPSRSAGGRTAATGRTAPAARASEGAAGETRTEPAPAPAPVQPVRKTLTLPEGKKIRVKLDTPLSSASSKVGDTFSATVFKPVHLNEGAILALPMGTKVEGTVTEVEPAKRVKGLAKLVLKFDAIVLEDGTRVPITASLSKEGQSTKKRDAATIAGGAAAGALLGKVLGHDGKDALIGAVAGGAIGTGVVMGTKGKEVQLAEGTEMALQLQQPVSVPQT